MSSTETSKAMEPFPFYFGSKSPDKMSSTETSKAMEPFPFYFGSKSLSDLILVVDHCEFHVHKMFLAARSDVFEAMLYGEFKESKEDRIEIKEADPNTLRRFLEIIYTGKTIDSMCFMRFKFEDKEAQHAAQPETFYSKVFAGFWSSCTELLKMADRFNMTPMVKDYMESIFNYDINKCEKTNCKSCFTIFFFSLIHDLDLSSCLRPKTYSRDVYEHWLKQDGKELVPETYPKKVVEYLISQLPK